MKAKDLMIGDWVNVGQGCIMYSVYKDKPQKVVSVFPKGVGIGAAYVPIEYIEPIPLTPEILEMNGLSKLVTYGTEKWVCDKFRLNEYDNKGVWRFCAYTNRNEDSVIYIRYVHELQHALKLCGIEKEIVL